MSNVRKTHKWRALITRDVVSIMRFTDGSIVELPLTKGERMFRTMRERDAFINSINSEHPTMFHPPNAVALPNAR